LYGSQIQQNMIRSETFTKVSFRQLQDCQVILSTLSMLSNTHIRKFTQYIPIRILVVDEASQIEIGAYVSVFNLALSNLQKICFIGDDKQCES
jgi:hypothetical protein